MSTPRPAATFALMLLLATPAAAQTTGFDAERFHPTTTARGYFSVDGAEVLQHLGWSAGIYTTYAHDPLVLRDPTGRVVKSGELVRHQLGVELTGSIGLLDRLEIGLGLPFIAYQQVDDRAAVPPSAVATAGLGDLRVDLKIQILDLSVGASQHLGFSAVVGGSAPTGRAGSFMGDGGFVGRPRLVLDWRSTRMRAALNFGAVLRGNQRVDALYVTNQLSYGAAAQVIVTRAFSLKAELFGVVDVGLPRAAGPLQSNEAPSELLAGVQLRLGQLELSLAGGAGLSRGYGTPDGRAMLGLRYVKKERPAIPWATRDLDGDGVLNGDDRCPDHPGPKENFGCPEVDSDGDGVPNRLDRCPAMDGPPANFGCPDSDSDGDGVVDRLDRCPTERGSQSNSGCPAPDRDHDGVPDVTDRCPDRYGTAANDGCPDIDSDGDGIIDRVDKCPFDPEIFNGVDDDDGCPDRGPLIATLAADKIVLFQPVLFIERTAILDPRSRKILSVVAKILTLHPEIYRVRVEGHTDNHGGAVENLDLSRLRAVAVRKYLVEQGGIDGHRLVAQGFGGDRPIADNRELTGRAQNRRIEFAIVERHN